MNLRNKYDIEDLDKRLSQVVKDEFPGPIEELYAAIDKVEINYFDTINTTITIRFGRYCSENSSKDNWQKEIELPLVCDNFEFIAGQFLQAIVDKAL